MKPLSYYMAPPKIRWAIKTFGDKMPISILDVGCGNHSPVTTKKYLPHCEYHGVDIQEYNLDLKDKQMMDRFIKVNVDGSGYDNIPAGYYHYIIWNHVIEHMERYEPVLRILCSKLRPGGIIYIAFPSERSLGFPSASGTLQFCDDETHLYLPSVREVANALLRCGSSVLYGGRSRDAIRACVGMPLLVWQRLRCLFGQKMNARGLWFVYGFESIVIGKRYDNAVTGESCYNSKSGNAGRPL